MALGLDGCCWSGWAGWWGWPVAPAGVAGSCGLAGSADWSEGCRSDVPASLYAGIELGSWWGLERDGGGSQGYFDTDVDGQSQES